MKTVGTIVAGCPFAVVAGIALASPEEDRNLGYFLTYMSNGLEANGPGARR